VSEDTLVRGGQAVMSASKQISLIAIVFGGLLGSANLGSAAVINFTTTGVFSVSMTNVLSGTDSSTLTFNDNSETKATGTPGNPSTVKLGDFQAHLPSGSNLTGSGTFTLTVSQTTVPPTSQSAGMISGGISGDIKNLVGKTGTVYITFSSGTSFQVGGVSYQLIDLQCGLTGTCSPGEAPDTLAIGVQDTNINADITATPEPALSALIGLGLIMLFVGGLRKSKQARNCV
jgi:hypothetical protein